MTYPALGKYIHLKTKEKKQMRFNKENESHE